MERFSLSDRVYAAIGSCLSCFGTHPQNEPDNSNTNSNERIRRARPDELEGLLADVVDTDAEAETMSLHSNIGEGRQRRKKRRGIKRITIFGWNMFGKPAIQLPEDGEEDDLLRRPTRTAATQGTISSTTLDSDAAPLETSAIDELSSEQAQARARVAEEEERRLKEERRQRKNQRKVIKRAARALTLDGGDEEFEGFQGSGDSYPRIPAFNRPHSTASASDSRGSTDVAHTPAVRAPRMDDADADDADLDGELYTRKVGSLRNSDGSDSRSRTSASRSQDNPVRYNHHYISQQPRPHMVPLPSRSELSPSLTSSSDAPRQKKRSKKSTSAKSLSSASNSQPSSLPSPIDTGFTTSPQPHIIQPSSPLSVAHQEAPLKTIPFDGYPVDKTNSYGFPSPGLGGGALPSPGLEHSAPSSGFGGPRRKNGDMGAFLATRGDS